MDEPANNNGSLSDDEVNTYFYEQNLPIPSSSSNNSAANRSHHGSSPNDNSASPELLTFNEVLAAEHSYLGKEMQILSRPPLLEEGCMHTVTILALSNLVLVPGQILPLNTTDLRTTNMITKCLKNNKVFGVVSYEIGPKKGKVGVTAEIFEYYMDNRNGSILYRIKTKGRQRFKILNEHPKTNCFDAQVIVLPEVVLPHPHEHFRLNSLNALRSTQPERCRRIDAVMTSWPHWVYDQYKFKELEKVIKTEFSHLTQGASFSLPGDQSFLSFWIAQNLPLEARYQLLESNSPIQRLRIGLNVLKKSKVLLCNYCGNVAGYQRHEFSMSIEGPQSTYVNPDGYLHEIITLTEAIGVEHSNESSTRFSWFPGYRWCTAFCKNCRYHMGWKFYALHPKLKPVNFWGLSRANIKVQFHKNVEL